MMIIFNNLNKVNRLNKLNLLINLKNNIKKKVINIKINKFNYSTEIKPKLNINKLEFNKDFIVYELTDRKFLVKIFCAGHAAFLLSIAFAITLKGLKKSDQQINDDYFNDNILGKSSKFIIKHSTAMSVISLTIGALISSFCQLYCVSNVRSLILLKGGKRCLINLFKANPLSDKTKKLEVPLKDMCFLNSRTDSNLLIRLKVNNHSGFYLLEKEGGKFNNLLFDKVIGLFRNIDKMKKYDI